MAPGSDLSRREPSNTTMMSGVNCAGRWLSPIDCCLLAMIPSSSAIRVDTDSAVLPISETAFCPWPGRQCGSQRAHSQPGCPLLSVSIQIWTSLGECRVAAWATSQRPIARGASPGPATPSTPRCGSGTVTGASGISQNTCLRCSSSVGSSQLDGGRDVGRSHPQQQVVGVGAAAFPQPPTGAGRDAEHGRRVRGVVTLLARSASSAVRASRSMLALRSLYSASLSA